MQRKPLLKIAALGATASPGVRAFGSATSTVKPGARFRIDPPARPTKAVPRPPHRSLRLPQLRLPQRLAPASAPRLELWRSTIDQRTS
jgi:hypothetical protein